MSCNMNIVVHLLDQPERSVSDEKREWKEYNARDDHHPGESPQGQLATKQDSVQIPADEDRKKSQAGCLPQVWGEGIGGCKGASPADSCNLRDVKTNGRPDAAY